jgi:hypothetical protein
MPPWPNIANSPFLSCGNFSKKHKPPRRQGRQKFFSLKKLGVLSIAVPDARYLLLPEGVAKQVSVAVACAVRTINSLQIRNLTCTQRL